MVKADQVALFYQPISPVWYMVLPKASLRVETWGTSFFLPFYVYNEGSQEFVFESPRARFPHNLKVRKEEAREEISHLLETNNIISLSVS